MICRWLTLTCLRHKVIGWFSYYIIFPRGASFILVLVFSNGLVDYAVTGVLMLYLTRNWESENLPKATAIINIQDGASMFMVIVLAHISDAYIGRFRMVAFSNALYVIGLLLLWVGEWRLSESSAARLFYVAVSLIAVGNAGHEVLLREFIADQFREREPKPNIDEERVGNRVSVWWRVARFSGATLATFTLSKNESWAYTFKISAITMGIAYLLFWFGFSYYYGKEEKPGSPLTLVYGVLKAAILKRHIDYPSDPSQFYQNHNNQLPLFPQYRCLRWLDKAAIFQFSSVSREQEETDRTNVFQVRQVKEVKLLLRMVPMWMTFIVYSLVKSTGNTFFIEQTTNLDDQIGNGFTVPIQTFFLIKAFTDFISASVCHLLIPKFSNEGTRHRCTLVRIGFGMVSCMLCCITAMQVEIRRLDLVRKRNMGVHDSMSIFWLTPQYCLWGVMEALAEEGLDNFFNGLIADHPEHRSYGPAITLCVLSIGKFISIACLFIFRSWFGDTINSSRLDQYYKMLAFLTLGNLFVYICVSGLYCSKAPVENEDLGTVLDRIDLRPFAEEARNEGPILEKEEGVTQAAG